VNRTLTLAGLACLIIGLTLGCGPSVPTYSLTYKYNPGMVFNYIQLSKGTVEAREGDSVTNSRLNSVTTNIEFTVRRVVDDTTWEIAQKMSSHFRSESRLDSSVTDTTESAPDLTMYVSPSGRIVDCEFATTDKNSPNNTAYMKEYFRQGTPVFPSQPVPIGYTWTQKYDVKVNGSHDTISTIYTVKGVEKRQDYECVVIGYAGSMIIPFEVDPADSLKRHGVDRIKNDGIVYQAVKEGITVGQTEKWTMDGDRFKLRNGNEIPYKVRVEYEVAYDLKSITK
jgi:hypothetical protein